MHNICKIARAVVLLSNLGAFPAQTMVNVPQTSTSQNKDEDQFAAGIWCHGRIGLKSSYVGFNLK